MPQAALVALEDLYWWTLAARAVRPLLRMERGPMTKDLAERLRRERESYLEVLGRDWIPSKYLSIERDRRFGDRVVGIYGAIVPIVPVSPRRPPAHRGQTVAFSVTAARLAANLINVRCAGVLGVGWSQNGWMSAAPPFPGGAESSGRR
jgi:hypothetical protein